MDKNIEKLEVNTIVIPPKKNGEKSIQKSDESKTFRNSTIFVVTMIILKISGVFKK